MRFVEPRWIKINSIEIVIRNTKGTSLKIAHLSDFHWSNVVSLNYLEESFKKVKLEKPDLILITGDFLNEREKELEPYAKILHLLPAIAPTFACAGNHDGGLWAYERGSYTTTFEIKRLLEKSGINYLENSYKTIKINGSEVLIGGLGDLWAGNCGPEIFMNEYDSAKADLKIMLTHNPDSKITISENNWDLLLAGHTHGGQMIFPGGFAPFAPVRDHSLIKGLHRYRGKLIHITPGIGNLHGLRLNSRPEISILNVKI